MLSDFLSTLKIKQMFILFKRCAMEESYLIELLHKNFSLNLWQLEFSSRYWWP